MMYVLFVFLLQLNVSFAQQDDPPPPPIEEPATDLPPIEETQLEDAPPPTGPAAGAQKDPVAEAQTQSNQRKQQETMEEEESLVVTLTKPFIYDREGKRDPFAAPTGKPPALMAGAVFGPFLELQEISLDSVVLKGIFLDPVNPKVLIEYDNKGKKAFKRLTIRDYLGENFGVISSIRDGQVIVVQTLEEGDKKSTTTRTLTIRK